MATKKVKKPYKITAYVVIDADDENGTTINREMELKFSSLSSLWNFIEDMEASAEVN